MTVGQTQVRIFGCDDQIEVREALRLFLTANGYAIECFDGPAALLETAAQELASVILLAMNYDRDTTSGVEGLELTAALRDQRGANDFVEKPWSNERLLQIVAKGSISQSAENKDMAGARRVQESLLPRAAVGEKALLYACRFLPAREVSGDCYDFYERRAGHFGFVVADVSGKGIPAAILMANFQALFRSYAYRDEAGPEPVLRALNAQFHESTSPESFATAFYADLDEASRELSYINCGHPPALLRKVSGEIHLLESGAVVLGAFPSWDAESTTVQLDAGDRLLVYSDGIVDAQGATGEEFGDEPLMQLFKDTGDLSPEEALPELEAAIQKHSGVSLFDDCTLFLASLR